MPSPDPSDNDAPRGLLLPWRNAWQRNTLRFDAIAGTTLAAYAVPSSIAYAQLAGMPVATGLYCYLFAGLAYALFGTSRQLAVGPTSAVALTLATTLGAIAVGDPARYAELAATTALFVGLIALGAWAMRWGAIVHFISETVLTGFKIGAGFVIAVSQLPLLLGLPGGGHDFMRTLARVARELPLAHPASLVLGLAALTLLVTGQMKRPRWPIPLMTVAFAIAMMYLPGVDGLGIATVGAIPGGLPGLAVPDLGLMQLDTLLPLAFACFLIAFNEASAAARLLAARHNYAVDPDRELLGLAGANVAIAFGHGFPSGGGLSQSLVNDQAGARTPLSLVVCSGWMALVLLFLTGLFTRLPQPLLAALVLASVQGMFKFDELRQLRRVSTPEFAIAVVTIVAVLGLGILKGVLLAAVFSLAMLIRRLAQPECVQLGRFPGSDHFASMNRYPEARAVPGTVIFRANAALLYFNADNVREHVLAVIDGAQGPLRRIVIDLSFSTEIDLSTARMLAELARRVRATGADFRIAEAHWRVRELLAEEHLSPLVGDLSRSFTVADLVDATT
ncbi:MAG: SulP family inorganic anion transporter [Betaproteobacteria bacterium]